MKKNKLILILLVTLCMFIGVNNISAAQEIKYESCLGLTETQCKDEKNGLSCFWVDSNQSIYKNRGIVKSYCNTNDLIYVSCGDAKDIPRQVPKVFSVVLSVFYLGVPVVLIISSIITLVGAVASSSDDNISKAKGKLFKKMIAAILVFLVVGIVKFGISLVPEEEGGVKSSELAECFNCFLNDKCGGAYYKTEVNGEWVETGINETVSPNIKIEEGEDEGTSAHISGGGASHGGGGHGFN